MTVIATRYDADVCVVGSGAGGAPLACDLAKRGLKVVVFERGPHYDPEEFILDELAACRRDMFVPDRAAGVREIVYGANPPIYENHLWAGACVGGGTVRMSGFFLRMREEDFRSASTYGIPPGATSTDWPIGYADLEAYYDQVERDVGVSGDAAALPVAKAASFPMPKLPAHPFSAHIDRACAELGYHAYPTPRAVNSEDYRGRSACDRNGFCGGYGCAQSAKGGTHVTYIVEGLKTGNLELRANTYVYRVMSTGNRIAGVCFVDSQGRKGTCRARTYVLACSAIETARLLLVSRDGGLANSSGQVGRNLAFQMPCEVDGYFPLERLPPDHLSPTPHVQRTIDDLRDLPRSGLAYPRGGSVIFLLAHPNPIQRAITLSYDTDGRRMYGRELRQRLNDYFRYAHLVSDAFIECLPNTKTHVTLSARCRDEHGIPAARVSLQPHGANLEGVVAMARAIAALYRLMGAERALLNPIPFTAGECQQGTCRFGHDPATSVLRPDCRSHDIANLYITDSSFMPSGIPVPPAFTIMANALRVAALVYRA
jgi:choline dehydrogenase-like flavoprotein